MSNTVTKPSLLDALIPVVVLIAMLAAAVYAFGLDSFGPNQVALIMAAAVAALIGIKNGISWAEIERGMIDTISVSLQSILILLMVGSLIGSWILSGTVPSMIYYGVELMSPDYFYLTACLVCALLGFSIGSSWTVAGTLGIGLMGIAAALGSFSGRQALAPLFPAPILATSCHHYPKPPTSPPRSPATICLTIFNICCGLPSRHL